MFSKKGLYHNVIIQMNDNYPTKRSPAVDDKPRKRCAVFVTQHRASSYQ